MSRTSPHRDGPVVLVGRPNVGKSTLFNRLAGHRQAIVTSVAGTTRDVIEGVSEWRGTRIPIVDTGGLFGATDDPLHAMVAERGRRAVEMARLVVFVVDGRDGLVSADEEIARFLRLAGVPVILAINKADDRRTRAGALEFHRLGFERSVEVSAEHGQGTGDLLDAIVAEVGLADPERSPGPEEPAVTRVALVGRPNVGKSSLVNRLLGSERAMVSEVPGTTRDVVDALIRWHGRTFRLLDTAGLRRPGRVARGSPMEAVSVVLTRRAIQHADVAIVVFDAALGVNDQDAAVAGVAETAGCGVVLVANKWDLVKTRGPDHVKTFDADVRRTLKFLEYAPILHVSALTGERVPRLFEAVGRVADARQRRVSTSELNRFVATITAAHPPVSPGRREVRILYATQTSVAPPSFVMFTNVATRFHFSYERFLVNQLREAFGFQGTPIRVRVRRRG